MAEASVSIKLSPFEFDLVREALVGMHKRVLQDTSPSITPDPAARQEFRAKALALGDLSEKLGVPS